MKPAQHAPPIPPTPPGVDTPVVRAQFVELLLRTDSTGRHKDLLHRSQKLLIIDAATSRLQAGGAHEFIPTLEVPVDRLSRNAAFLRELRAAYEIATQPVGDFLHPR